VSHEEPDLETKEPPHTVPPGHPPDLRGDLDVRTIAVGIVVAAIMGASYPYMVLKLGFGPNVSVVAAFFGFLFLRALDLIFRTRHSNRWQNNLTEAAGTSAAQTAFMCVLLGAFDILRHNRPDIFKMELTPFDSFLWLSAACSLGVFLAVPLRRHFVVDEKLPYVDGLATAETMIVLDPPKDATPEIRRQGIAAFKAVMLGVALSGLLMFFREDARLMHEITGGKWGGLPEGWNAPWAFFKWVETKLVDGQTQEVVHGVILARLAVGASYSLLSIGSGMIVGLRINMSMMLGGVLAYVVAPYFLIKYGVALHPVEDPVTHQSTLAFTDSPSRNEVLFWVMWPATGMLVVGGLTALALRWKILIGTFKSLRSAKIGTSELPLSVVGIGVAFCSIMLCIVQAALLGMPIWMTLLAIVLSLPLMLVGLRVLGETNWGPISALSNMMQGLFAAIAPGNVAANMVASGTTGTIATSSEAIMQDYKCGDMIGTKPRNLTIMQLIAVPVGAAAVSWIYPALVKTYHLFDWVDAKGETHGPGLSSPISNKWSGFATILKDGASALPSSALYALIIFSVLGVIFTVLEGNSKLKKWVPSPTGLGIGMLVPFAVISTMFIGGIIGWIWERQSKKTADTYMVPFASGLIAGEAIVAVVGAIYFAATGH
jgi:uncharacterized oligopeptide transporter (OPT) family protein